MTFLNTQKNLIENYKGYEKIKYTERIYEFKPSSLWKSKVKMVHCDVWSVLVLILHNLIGEEHVCMLR